MRMPRAIARVRSTEQLDFVKSVRFVEALAREEFASELLRKYIYHIKERENYGNFYRFSSSNRDSI